jgi:hypothetical protein
MGAIIYIIYIEKEAARPRGISCNDGTRGNGKQQGGARIKGLVIGWGLRTIVLGWHNIRDR